MITKLKQVYDRSLYCLIVLIMGGLTITTFLQVVGRYVFNRPPSWSEELARYLFVWLVFLAASVGFRRGVHLGVDFFVGLLPTKVRRVVSLLTQSFLFILLGVVVWQGVAILKMIQFQLSPAMRIPMRWVYAAIPVGTALMLLEVTALLFRSMMNLQTPVEPKRSD